MVDQDRPTSRAWRRSKNFPAKLVAIAEQEAQGKEIENLICGKHYGQRPKISTAQTGRTHGSTGQQRIAVQKPLANKAPSTQANSLQNAYILQFGPVGAIVGV